MCIKILHNFFLSYHSLMKYFKAPLEWFQFHIFFLVISLIQLNKEGEGKKIPIIIVDREEEKYSCMKIKRIPSFIYPSRFMYIYKVAWKNGTEWICVFKRSYGRLIECAFIIHDGIQNVIFFRKFNFSLFTINIYYNGSKRYRKKACECVM